MPKVIIAARTADQPAARQIAAELQQYVSSVAVLAADERHTAQQSVATAAAMVVVAGDGWLDGIAENAVLRETIVQALNRSDLLVHIALLPGATVPPVVDLPDDLRPLAYMQTMPVNPETSLGRDSRRIGVRIAGHIKQEGARSPQTAPPAVKPNRGLPWHIFIIATAVITGLLFILIPNLRGDRDESGIVEEAVAPMSAAQNAAIITPQDGLMIGVAAGLSGGLAGDGGVMVNGVRLAVADRAEVTVDGQTFAIDLLTQDAGCTPEGGIQAAETFTTALTAIPGVIGHMCNVSCFPASGIYDENNLATISPACDAPGLTAFAGFNRTVPSQAAGARSVAGTLMTTLDIGSVVVISDEEVLGTQIADTFIEAFAEAGGDVVARYEVSSRTLDPAALADEVNAAGADLVFFGGRVPAAVSIYTAIRELDAELPFMLADTVDAGAFITEAGDISNGVLTYAIIPPGNEDITALTERYTSVYEMEPSTETLIHAYAYDATNILLNGVEAIGEVDVVGNLLVDRAALQAYLRSYRGDGIIGNYACDGSGDCSGVTVQMLTIEDSLLVNTNP